MLFDDVVKNNPLLRKALVISRRLGDLRTQAALLGNLAILEENRDRHEASMALYREIMFGESGLSRQERELLATVASAEQSCHY